MRRKVQLAPAVMKSRNNIRYEYNHAKETTGTAQAQKKKNKPTVLTEHCYTLCYITHEHYRIYNT